MKLFWIWLTTIRGIGSYRAKKLLTFFENPEDIYNASRDELKYKLGNAKALIENILQNKSLNKSKKILKLCNKYDIKILTMADELYPIEVKLLPKAPIVLYYKGYLQKNSMGVGIVGARICTDYGKAICKEATEFLAINNIPIISGLAKGIDSYAHRFCIENQGYTIAFLGNSVEICYPSENFKLMKKIIDSGAVISEYPPGTRPSKYNFPKRNYLLSAWCRKVLVVEASETSGSLITASCAMKQNRKVLAVPNNIYNKEGFGTNNLILNGAEIYLRPEQLSIDSRLIKIKPKKQEMLLPDEDLLISQLQNHALSIDELVCSSSLSKDKIIELITLMEIENKVKFSGGKVSIPYGLLNKHSV